jgi:hypothetical protein
MKLYTICEAKAKLWEILRRVRERAKAVLVMCQRRPVADVQHDDTANSVETIEARLARLLVAGVLVRTGARSGAFGRVARRRGALARFLADRDE